MTWAQSHTGFLQYTCALCFLQTEKISYLSLLGAMKIPKIKKIFSIQLLRKPKRLKNIQWNYKPKNCPHLFVIICHYVTISYTSKLVTRFPQFQQFQSKDLIEMVDYGLIFTAVFVVSARFLKNCICISHQPEQYFPQPISAKLTFF